jgi:hypothetical protein
MNKMKKMLAGMFSKPLRIVIFFVAFFVSFYLSSSNPDMITSAVLALLTALVLSAWNEW